MKRKTTIIRSAVAAASAVGLSLAAPALAEGDKSKEQQQGAQMEETEKSLEEQQEKVSGEEQKVGGEEKMKEKSGQKAAIDPKQVQKVFGSDVEIIAIQDLPEDQIRKLQEELQALGLYRGSVDGQMGPQTRNALNSFVRRQTEINEKLLRSGQVTTQLMDALGVSHSDVQPVKGEEEGLQQPMEQPSPEPQEQPQPQPEPQTQPEPGQGQEGLGEEIPPGEPGGAPQDDVEEPQY